MEQNPSWKANSHTGGQDIPPSIEPEGSLLYSQEPAIGICMTCLK